MLQDNRDIQFRRLLTENTRQTNEVRCVLEYCDLPERENARILEEQDGASGRAAELERLLEKNRSLVEELKESKSCPLWRKRLRSRKKKSSLCANACNCPAQMK